MKKSVFIVLFLGLVTMLNAQNLFYTYESNNADYIRIYHVINDTHIVFKEYPLSDLFQTSTRNFTQIKPDITDNVLTIEAEDISPVQFTIADDCSLTSQRYNAFIPARSRMPGIADKMKQQTANWKDWSRDSVYASALIQLEAGRQYFYKDDYNIWLITENRGTYSARKLTAIEWVGFSYSEKSATLYAPNKLAYIDPYGYVVRVDYQNPESVTVNKAVWQALREASADKDKDTILNILGYQLGMYDGEPESVDSVISILAGSCDSRLIVTCLNYADSLIDVGWAIHTPLPWIFKQNDPVLLDEILTARPDLVNLRWDGGMGYEAHPIRELIEDDKVELVRVYLKHLDDVNDVPLLERSERDYDGGDYRKCVNMLSYAVSDEMKELLIGAGVETTIPFTKKWAVETYLTDSRVNVRTSPSLSGTIIDQLNEGDEVTVLAVDPYFYQIDYYKGHWIKIRFKGDKVGYIFEKYIYQFFQ